MSRTADEIFEEAYEKYSNALFRKAYLLTGDFHKAEDCVQEAYMILYERLRSDSGELNLYPFLKKLIYNVASRTFRAENPLPSDCFGILGGYDKAAEEIAVEKDMLAALDAALRKQPIRNSTAVICHYAYDMSYTQVSEIIGDTSKNTAKIIGRTSKEIADNIKRCNKDVYGRVK